MKTAGWFMAALLLGLAIGSWSVKADLRKARAEAADLKQQLDRRGAKQGKLNGITSMLKIPESGQTQRASRPAPRPAPAASAPRVDAASATTAETKAVSITVTAGDSNADVRANASMGDRIQEAKNLWEARAALARNAFMSNVATGSDQAAQFDVLMAAMNLRLSNSIRTWVDNVKTQEDVTSEAGIRLASQVSQALVLTYDEFDRTMPSDWREKAGKEFDMLSFIDPQVAMPLTEVDGIIQTNAQASGRHPRLFGRPPPASGEARP